MLFLRNDGVGRQLRQGEVNGADPRQVEEEQSHLNPPQSLPLPINPIIRRESDLVQVGEKQASSSLPRSYTITTKALPIDDMFGLED